MTKKVPKDPNQRNISTLYSRRRALVPTYIPIAHHVYYDGSSFRVRVRINGKTNSFFR